MAGSERGNAPGALTRLKAVALRGQEKFDPVLNALFLFRPTLFIPALIISVAGLAAGRATFQRYFFWRADWSWTGLLLFTGVTLITAASFANAKPGEGGELALKGYPSPPAAGAGTADTARRLGRIVLVLGLVLMLPAGWLAVAGGGALYLFWGQLYAARVALWKSNLALETALHTWAGMALFYIGWAASGAPLTGNLPVAAPYALMLAAFGAHIAITHGPAEDRAAALPSRNLVAGVSAFAVTATVLAAALGMKFSDPVISTSAILTLPFFVVALVLRRNRDIVYSSRYGLLIIGILVGSRYPWLYVPTILLFYLSRYYYRRHLGLLHPTFQSYHP